MEESVFASFPQMLFWLFDEKVWRLQPSGTHAEKLGRRRLLSLSISVRMVLRSHALGHSWTRALRGLVSHKHTHTNHSKNKLGGTLTHVRVLEMLPELPMCVQEHMMPARTQKIGQVLSKNIKCGTRHIHHITATVWLLSSAPQPVTRF